VHLRPPHRNNPRTVPPREPCSLNFRKGYPFNSNEPIQRA
jgi:hypothetical protein